MTDNRPSRTIMAVRPHPDDECFTVGGSLAKYSDEGVNTVLVTCTGGENGEIVDPELDTPENREHLGELRYQELQRSCGVLGIGQLEMLGYRDSGMAGTPENEDPRSFNKANLSEATGRLVRLIRRYRPDVLVTENEEGSYGHPDHIMTNRVSVAAFDAAADPAFGPDLGPAHRIATLYYNAFSRSQVVRTWRRMRELGLELPWHRDEDGQPSDTEPEWGLPDEAIAAVIDIRPQLPRKLESLRAHRTQIKPDLWILTLPPDVLESFLGQETFARVKTDTAVTGRHDDLFAGIRGAERVAEGSR